MRRLRCLCCFVVLLVAVPAGAPLAQGGSDLERFREALQLLDTGQLREGVEILEQLTRDAPSNPAPHAALATVANRLGHFERALRHADQALSLGLDTAGLQRERVVALLGLKRWDQALAGVDALEARAPGEGLTSELRGRALLGRGAPDAALEAFAEAERRDPSLAPAMASYRAIIAANRGQLRKALAEVAGLINTYPDSPLGRNARQGLTRAVLQSLDKPWSVSLALYGGYDDNVVGLGNDLPLPGGISDQGSGYVALDLGAGYRWTPTPESFVSVGYGLRAAHFFDLSAFDSDEHTLTAEYARRILPRLAGSLRGFFEYLQADGDAFRRRAGVRPSLVYRWAESSLTELAFTYADDDYKFTSLNPFQNRDGQSYGLSVYHRFAPPVEGMSVTLGAFATRNQSDGSDFDFDALGVLGSVGYQLPWHGLESEVALSVARNDYDNPNSLAGPAGFAFSRDDDVLQFNVVLRLPVHQGVTAYARYDYRRYDSNVIFYDFEQNVVSAGLNMRF